MSNVLDLKDRIPGEPQDVQIPTVEQFSGESINPEPLAVPVEPDTDEHSADALPDFPVAASWTAHHPLAGDALMRHRIVLGGVIIAGVLIAIWQKSFVPLFVLVCGAVALELRERFGEPISVNIDHRGVEIDGERHDHASFASFHIHQMPDNTLELSLRSEKPLLPHLRLPLGDQDPRALHAVLSQYIPEGDHVIPPIQYFIRKPRS